MHDLKSGPQVQSSEQVVKDIRRATRKQYSAEEKIGIVLDGLRGEYSIAELCRREGIAESLYYSWSKEFLEAGKRHAIIAQERLSRKRRTHACRLHRWHREGSSRRIRNQNMMKYLRE
jgi:transposase